MPISIPELLYLVTLTLVLPVLAVMGRKQMLAGIDVPRSAIYIQAAVFQLLLAVFSLWIAMRSHTTVANWFAIDPNPALAIAAATLLIFAIIALNFGMRDVDPLQRQLFRLLGPQTRRQEIAWIAICALVAFTEELTYRAVLPDVLSKMSRNPLVIIAISSLLFGLAHLLQGAKGFFLTALFAVPLHLIVHFSGTLWHAIVVHFVYDVIAGFVIARWARNAAGEAPSLPSAIVTERQPDVTEAKVESEP